jgi:hypothetical protein
MLIHFDARSAKQKQKKKHIQGIMKPAAKVGKPRRSEANLWFDLRVSVNHVNKQH